MSKLSELSETSEPPGIPEPAVALRLEEVSLRYRLAKQRIPSFKDYAIHWLRGALTHEHFWAVKDVSFELRRGEVVGIVGRNGAGKSSLLKVIAGVLPPTSGKILVAQQIAPILELGTGFDPELTGRENIHLNALLLGHSRAAIREKEESIIEFTELGDFIDSPLRTYSTGMLGRLGFSIAAAWHPDLLILDEVFAAGDAAFTVKCEKRVREFQAAGVTILLVSHAPQVLWSTCQRCLWLDHGRLVADGPTHEVVEGYLRQTLEGTGEGVPAATPA